MKFFQRSIFFELLAENCFLKRHSLTGSRNHNFFSSVSLSLKTVIFGIELHFYHEKIVIPRTGSDYQDYEESSDTLNYLFIRDTIFKEYP